MRITNFLVLCLLGLTLSARRPHSRRLHRGSSGSSLPPTVGLCNGDLLRSFNLYGRRVARPTALSVCPNVRTSCCTGADQVAIYDNWVVDNEEASLEAKFANYTNSIETFFAQAEEATTIAASVLTTMEKMKNNECKMMARRIVSYQIGDLQKALLQTFRDTYEYLTETHKGLYCSLCDAESHVFFNPQAKVLRISEEFCRSLISNTLTSLMYLRVHLPKYINLLSTFMGSCNARGRFIKATLPTGIIQTVDVTNEKMLNSCFKGRNTATWLTTCQSICQKWMPGQTNPFFAPDLNQISSSLAYILKNMANFTAEAATASNTTASNASSTASSPTTTTPSSQRVLSEKSKKSTKRLRKDRGLQQINLPTTVAPPTPQITTMPNTFPAYDRNQFDEFGHPLNYLNFTGNGTNHTSIFYLISKESKRPAMREGHPVNLTSNIIYQSQNTSNITGLNEWTVVVNTKGADFFFASQYSVITMDAIESLYDLGDTPTTQPVVGIPPVQARKLKQKRARKLASASLLTVAVATFLALFNV